MDSLTRISYASSLTPLEIVNENFEINIENLTRILKNKDIADSEVSIFSIAGITRKGKSFMLNLLMRFLKNHNRSDCLGNMDEEIEKYFSSKSGNASDTTGIWMWPLPFYVEGIETPIILMDTQGVYGSNTDDNMSAKVFAIRYKIFFYSI
jgi:hypothetical protein